MAPTTEGVDPKRLAVLFEEHGPQLERFLLGVLRDRDAARDVKQIAFVRLLERPPADLGGGLKAWLFQVAFHEALALRRRLRVRNRHDRGLAFAIQAARETAEQACVREETIDQVRAALDSLPENQRAVVCARVYDNKRFALIAKEFGLPLGTVLTRMRLALEKLRALLRLEGAQEEDRP